MLTNLLSRISHIIPKLCYLVLFEFLVASQIFCLMLNLVVYCTEQRNRGRLEFIVCGWMSRVDGLNLFNLALTSCHVISSENWTWLSCRFCLTGRFLAARLLFSTVIFPRAQVAMQTGWSEWITLRGSWCFCSNSGGVCQSAVPCGLGQKGCHNFSGSMAENWFSETNCYWNVKHSMAK